MARRGTDVFRISVRGAGRAARSFTRMQRQTQDEIVAELRQFGEEARVLFVGAAPRDTEQLRERITAVPFFGRAARPRVSIRVRPDLEGHQGDKIDGFDYLDVTRRGHRSRTIEPRQARALKVHVEGHRNAEIFEFRASVPGARVTVDWVVPAAERAERLADAAQRRLGRRIERRVLR